MSLPREWAHAPDDRARLAVLRAFLADDDVVIVSGTRERPNQVRYKKRVDSPYGDRWGSGPLFTVGIAAPCEPPGWTLEDRRRRRREGGTS